MTQRMKKAVPGTLLFNSMGSLTFHEDIVDQVDLRRYSKVQDSFDVARATMERFQDIGILLLEGGADIHPSLYGQENTHSWPSGGVRDEWEMGLIKIAEQLNIPILGICRGHQLYAAYRGGTLHQDIRACLGVHGHWDGWLELSGIFAEWYPDGYYANSAHHQCVDQVPEGGEVIARDAQSPEIIEAIVYPRTEDHVPTFTVQFHPEFRDDWRLLTHIRDYLRS